MRAERVGAGIGATVASLIVVAVLAVASPASAAAIPDFGTQPVQDTSSPGGSAITDVRVGANEGFDRFVVEFAGEVGAYFVSYVDAVTQDGSGDVVPVEGEALIQVSLNGVPNEPPAPQETINANLSGLLQVVGAGAGFEATVSYGLGTTEQTGFRAFTLTDPSRLVVDIAHPDVTPTATNTADPTASTAPPSAAETSEEISTAADDEPNSNNWLLWFAGALILVALIAGVYGMRMRRSR